MAWPSEETMTDSSPSRSQRTIESLLLEFRANLAQSAISGSTLTGHVWLHTGEHVEAAIKWLTEMLNAREALPSETGETKACYGKPVAWIREWDGDDSDLGNFVVEWGTEAPADNHEWEPLYAESEGLHECMR